jgi:hypothetical protein
MGAASEAAVLTFAANTEEPLSVPSLRSDEGRKAKVAPMTDRLRSSYERDCLPYTNKTARSAVLAAIGQALNSCYEVPQELPREMLAFLMQLDARHEE